MKKEDYKIMKNKIEAILFSYADWISVEEILDILELKSQTEIERALGELQQKYENDFPFNIVYENDMWSMKLKEEYDNLIVKVVSSTEIPKKVLKVLAVIAYEQPITKTRLNEILGKSVVQEINYLFKYGFVIYQKKGIGRYYKVTKKFNDYFKVDNPNILNKEMKKDMESIAEDIINVSDNSEEENKVLGENVDSVNEDDNQDSTEKQE